MGIYVSPEYRIFLNAFKFNQVTLYWFLMCVLHLISDGIKMIIYTYSICFYFNLK